MPTKLKDLKGADNLNLGSSDEQQGKVKAFLSGDAGSHVDDTRAVEDNGGKKNKEEKKKGKVKGGEDAAAEEKGKKKGKSKGGGGEEGKDGGKKSGKKGGKKKKKKGEADEDEQDEPEIDLAALNFGDNLDDLTKAVVFRNTLLGHHDLWGAARLEGIDLVAIEDGELDTGDGIWAGLFKDPDEDDPDESYVLNPLAGLGDTGNPWITVESEVKVTITKGKMEGGEIMEEEEEEEEDENEKEEHPWWKCWGYHDPWSDFTSQVNKLVTEPVLESENDKNPFKGVHESEVLWNTFEDKLMKGIITKQLPLMKEKCGTAHEDILDKVEVDEALRRTLAEGEKLYDMPPMRIKQFVRRIPSQGDHFERFGVVMYITDRHLFIWDESTTEAARIEQKPILGAYELFRYELVHQRVDDMLMYQVPIGGVKGYSLDVSVESHAIAHIDKERIPMCLVISFLSGALCFMCWFVGRFENHEIMTRGVADGSGAFAQETDAGDGVEQRVEDFAVDFIRTRWTTFVLACCTAWYAAWYLFERPRMVISPPLPYKTEDRLVLIGAKEPLTQEHMIMELHLQDDYSTVECKDFLRVMQITAPHLNGELQGTADAETISKYRDAKDRAARGPDEPGLEDAGDTEAGGGGAGEDAAVDDDGNV